MGIGNLQNCPRCERLFVTGIYDVCPVCVKEIEEEFKRCVQQLKLNKNLTIYELSEAAEVSVRQITRFIFERRLLASDFPNLSVPCESCGKMTKVGRVCIECREGLQKSLNHNENQINPPNDKGFGYHSKK